MEPQRIYRTYRSHALLLAARHDVPPAQALRALARAAAECPSYIPHFEVASFVSAKTEEWIMESKETGLELEQTG